MEKVTVRVNMDRIELWLCCYTALDFATEIIFSLLELLFFLVIIGVILWFFPQKKRHI